MKKLINVISAVLLALILYVMFFVDFAPKSEVTTPEVKKTGSYERPVKEGNCYHHTTATGSVLACG